MTQRKIKFVLIGCGAIANKHVISIKKIDNAEIAGAYDIDSAAAEKFGNKYGISVYGNVDKMINDTNPDVLNILTPSGDHAQRVLDLVRFNKHFVVEKPLALRLEDVDQIVNECDSRGLKIFVVQQNRFNPPIKKLKEALVKGRFGKMVLGTIRVRWRRDQSYYDEKLWRGTWAHDGGALVNQGLHHVDMLMWMMGQVESVMAKSARRLVNIEAEDTLVATVKFKNGALGAIEITTAARPKDMEGSISVLGENGAAEIGGFFMNELKTWNFNKHDTMDDDIWDKHARVPDEFAWNHAEFFKDVVNSIITNKSGLIDGLEGRKSVELVNAIYESAETGKEVFLYFTPQKSRLGKSDDK